ncbi:hypothetical protein [Streptomyces sp. NPDC002104]
MLLGELLRPVSCAFGGAAGGQSDTRTVCVSQGRMLVTRHAEACPHPAADRILAEGQKPRDIGYGSF